MKHRFNLTLLLLLPLLGLLCSCATVGRKFDFSHYDRLELGKLKNSEYEALFGRPLISVSQTLLDGKFEQAKYDYLSETLDGRFCERVLILEFKDGVLNGYAHTSSFGQEQTRIDLEKVGQLRTAVGRATKKEAKELLGPPDGEAHCPTEIHEFKEKCGKAAELWTWVKLEDISPRRRTRTEQSVTVLFDIDGKVTDVQSSSATRQ